MAKATAQKTQGRIRRHARIRARVSGTAACPRLAVFRSNRYIYAQLIDDECGVTVAAADSRTVAGASALERAIAAGKVLGEAAKAAGVEQAVFDRGGFRYQGVVAALADGARGAGLAF
jgi:large subunit ribosomal protein L18